MRCAIEDIKKMQKMLNEMADALETVLAFAPDEENFLACVETIAQLRHTAEQLGKFLDVVLKTLH